jgi:protein-S-isoprenylcysteine O-methyltransferase Ste14
VSQFAGWIPAFAALLGSFLPGALVLLRPRTDLSIAAKLTSTSLIFVGNILAIYALRYLGRSFSLLPEGRSLVTGGPYRYIRHPLYVAESFATLGAMINFLSPWAVAIVVAQLSLNYRYNWRACILKKRSCSRLFRSPKTISARPRALFRASIEVLSLEL